MKKYRKDSFAARLTPEQRDELFAAIADGLSYTKAAIKAYEWIMENAAALATDPASRPGLSPDSFSPRVLAQYGGVLRVPPRMSIHTWYHTTVAEQRYAAAKQVAVVAQACCPEDYDAQTRRTLGQAKFLATLEGLRVSDIATLEKNEIAREKLALEREKLERDVRHQRRELVIDRARVLLERARGGEKGADLQHQIDLALEEIRKMKYGEDA